MFSKEGLFKVLSTLDNKNIECRRHFLDRLNIRGQTANIEIKDVEEIKKILLNRCPVYVEYLTEDEYKLFYDITDKYDLVIIIYIYVSSPTKVRLITMYPQKVNRRLNQNGREL